MREMGTYLFSPMGQSRVRLGICLTTARTVTAHLSNVIRDTHRIAGAQIDDITF